MEIVLICGSGTNTRRYESLIKNHFDQELCNRHWLRNKWGKNTKKNRKSIVPRPWYEYKKYESLIEKNIDYGCYNHHQLRNKYSTNTKKD